MCAHLAFGGEFQRLGEIAARADDRPAALRGRAPPIAPRTVMRLSTTSKIGVAKSPGGRPTRLTVPRRRARRMA
jgi:hypothetical protein